MRRHFPDRMRNISQVIGHRILPAAQYLPETFMKQECQPTDVREVGLFWTANE